MTLCAQRSALCWIAVVAVAVAVLTGRWWLLLVAGGVWLYSRRSMRPRLQVLAGGNDGRSTTAQALWNANGPVPGASDPNFAPSTGASGSSGGATIGATCASY